MNVIIGQSQNNTDLVNIIPGNSPTGSHSTVSQTGGEAADIQSFSGTNTIQQRLSSEITDLQQQISINQTAASGMGKIQTALEDIRRMMAEGSRDQEGDELLKRLRDNVRSVVDSIEFKNANVIIPGKQLALELSNGIIQDNSLEYIDRSLERIREEINGIEEQIFQLNGKLEERIVAMENSSAAENAITDPVMAQKVTEITVQKINELESSEQVADLVNIDPQKISDLLTNI